MKNLISILLLPLIIFYNACTSNYIIKKDISSLNILNEKLTGEMATLIMTDGKKIDGKNIVITGDSIFYTDIESRFFSGELTSNINKIVITDHGRGAMEGLGYGCLSGFLIGAAIGAASFDPDDTGFLVPNNRFDAALTGGIVTGIPFTVLGLIFGAGGGHTDNYILNESKIEQIKINIKTNRPNK